MGQLSSEALLALVLMCWLSRLIALGLVVANLMSLIVLDIRQGLAVVILMVAGLGICALSRDVKYTLLATVFWWVGLLIALVGLLLVLATAVVWIAAQLRAMLGV